MRWSADAGRVLSACCEIYWQIDWLSCIFSLYFALIYWLWRWECDEEFFRSHCSLGSHSGVPFTSLEWRRMLILVGYYRLGQWRGVSDKNHSRPDTLHQSHVKQSEEHEELPDPALRGLQHLHLLQTYLTIVTCLLGTDTHCLEQWQSCSVMPHRAGNDVKLRANILFDIQIYRFLFHRTLWIQPT